VSRMPGLYELSQKSPLADVILAQQRLFPESFRFMPQTWHLPEQLAQFQQDHAHREATHPTSYQRFYIVKPNDGRQGAGIFLITDPHDARLRRMRRSHVVQDYVANPLLLDGFKFDMRLYVFIQSLEPFRAYLHREGMARLCTTPYARPTPENMDEIFMHLTNFSLNKRSDNYRQAGKASHNNDNPDDHDDDDDEGGSKRLLSSVMETLAAEGSNTSVMWANIEDLVCKTLLAMYPHMLVEYRKAVPKERAVRPFQLLGFDVLIDETLHPHLIEINANPSLRID
ncbi:uncharacterized protein MONBRDRAFT_1873, partial [Monosiga brevicollis MX1]